MARQFGCFQRLETIQCRFTKSYFPYLFAISLSCEERLTKLKLPPLYNRMVYLGASYVIKCLFNSISVPSHFIPELNSREMDTLLFKHQCSRTNCVKFSICAFSSFFLTSLQQARTPFQMIFKLTCLFPSKYECLFIIYRYVLFCVLAYSYTICQLKVLAYLLKPTKFVCFKFYFPYFV